MSGKSPGPSGSSAVASELVLRFLEAIERDERFGSCEPCQGSAHGGIALERRAQQFRGALVVAGGVAGHPPVVVGHRGQRGVVEPLGELGFGRGAGVGLLQASEAHEDVAASGERVRL